MDLRPPLEGRVGRHDQVESLVTSADDLEERFGSRFGERHVAQLVEDDQVVLFHLGEKGFQLPLLPHLQHVGDQGARTPEAHSFSLGASRKTQ